MSGKRLRVIDLTMHLSGPYCCWLLASQGADVIKVERPDGGDPTRQVHPFVHGESLYFGSVNRNKRGIVLDLKSEDGKAAFGRLLKTADVLVENFRSGVLARLGFSDEAIKAINPDLIVASISGFGQRGAMINRPAFDIVIQGMSGMMSVTGPVDGDPVPVGMSIADVTTGVFAALAVQSALLERERTGVVRRVDVSMLDCQLALLENAAAAYLNADVVASRRGSSHPQVSPFQAYQTRDRIVVVAADGERNWVNFCKALGLEELLEDARFSSNARRISNLNDLNGIIGPIIAEYRARELEELLVRWDVPCGQVNSIAEALDLDPVSERQVISTVTRGDGRTFRYVASPVAARGAYERAAPDLGEHTEEILNEIGCLEADDIADS